MKKLVLFLILSPLISCNSKAVHGPSVEDKVTEINVQNLGELVDIRDSNVYKIIGIENQVWMAENLRFDAGEGSYCYDDNPENCKKGRIYTWATAMNGSSQEGSQGICPNGWHIPTSAEWDNLIHVIGGDSMAELLKENGIGFNATLNGGRMQNPDGSFEYMRRGTDVCFWTSESDGDFAFDRNLNSINNIISKRRYPKNYGFCVRCVKDEV